MEAKIIGKHLECAICMDIYNNPKELTCRHLFCKSCLDRTLSFEDDGSATIVCPQCREHTIIGPMKTTNDLSSSFTVNSILGEWIANNESSSTSNKMSCDCIDCQNNTSAFCLECRQFMCKSCCSNHDKLIANHAKSAITFGEDNLLEILCETHNTVCQFICCTNKVTCLYCVNRDHTNHQYETLEKTSMRMKEALDTVIENLQQIPQLSFATKQCISASEKHFEQTLKSRKIICLSNYMSFLDNEEQQLREEFSDLSLNHDEQFIVSQSQSNIDPLKEMLKWTDAKLCLLKENVVDSILSLRSTNILPLCTISLSENNFLSDHPLGELVVDIEEVAISDLKDASSFKCNVPEIHEDESTAILLAVMRKLLQEAESTSWHSLKDFLGDPLTGKQTELQKELSEKSVFEYATELIKNDKQDKLNLLLLERADVVMMHGGEYGGTLLFVAAQHNNLAIMKQLITAGSCVDDTDQYGDTVLHDASREGSEECLSWLCEEHPQLLNVKDNNGYTALHYAVSRNKLNSVKILCKHDVCFNIKSSSGQTALDTARTRNYNDCFEEIQSVLRLRDREDVETQAAETDLCVTG